LCFGGNRNCAIFQRISEGYRKLLHINDIQNVSNYIDDLCGYSNEPCYRSSLKQFEKAFHLLADKDCGNVPLSLKKCLPPATKQRYLGYIIDTVAGTISLTKEKLIRYSHMLNDVLQRFNHNNETSFQVKKLYDLACCLMHAASAVRAGWTFSRRLLNLFKHRKMYHKCHLTPGAVKDLLWWRQALRQTKGISYFLALRLTPASDMKVWSDASGYALGFVCGREWFQYTFTQTEKAWHINAKELYAITLGASTFSEQFRGKNVLFITDSHSSVEAAKRMFCTDPLMMGMYRHLQLIALSINANFTLEWIEGARNEISDAISRDKWSFLQEHAPYLNRSQTKWTRPSLSKYT
jgi:hypothetical protein